MASIMKTTQAPRVPFRIITAKPTENAVKVKIRSHNVSSKNLEIEKNNIFVYRTNSKLVSPKFLKII